MFQNIGFLFQLLLLTLFEVGIVQTFKLELQILAVSVV